MTQHQNGIIGARVQYESGGQLYQGVVLDKVRVRPHNENGEAYDLYIIDVGGKLFKISPVMIRRVITI